MRGDDPELGQHADGVSLVGRLDHPRQDQRPERVIGETIEAEVGVQAGQDLPQNQRGGASDHCRRPSHGAAGVVQVQGQLPGVTAFLGQLQQQRELVVGVGRADVLDAQDRAATLVHDRDRGRARGGPHPSHEHAHSGRLPTPTSPVRTTSGQLRR
jgi:hypothetical protein